MQNNFCERPEMLDRSIGVDVAEHVRQLATTKSTNAAVNATTMAMALKTYYMPLYSLSREGIESLKNSKKDNDTNLYFINDDSPEGIKAFYKMSYVNVIKYATPEQAQKYHSLRKQYLCWAMNEAIKNTDMCYQIMGSDSPASDVDITVLSKKVILPAIEQIDKVISRFHEVNALYFYDPIEDVFDANLYATQFLQVVVGAEEEETLKKVKVEYNKSYPSNTRLSTANYSYGCFGIDDGVDAQAFNIPTYDVNIQRQFALARLSDYVRKNPKPNVSGKERTLREYFVSVAGDEPEDAFKKLFEAMSMYMSHVKSLQDMIALATLTIKQNSALQIAYDSWSNDTPSERTYKLLISASYHKRNAYLTSGSEISQRRQQDADDIVNLMSAATFFVKDAYHSQGAFLDVTGQDWNISLTVDNYINSIFDNLGFLVEYADTTVHEGLDSYQRSAKMNKYFLRICNAFLKVNQLIKLVDGDKIESILKEYIKNASLLDSSRKTIGTSQQDSFLCMLKQRGQKVLAGRFASFRRESLNMTCSISRNLSDIAGKYVHETFRLFVLTGLDSLENNQLFIRRSAPNRSAQTQSNVLKLESVGEEDICDYDTDETQNASMRGVQATNTWAKARPRSQRGRCVRANNVKVQEMDANSD